MLTLDDIVFTLLPHFRDLVVDFGGFDGPPGYFLSGWGINIPEVGSKVLDCTQLCINVPPSSWPPPQESRRDGARITRSFQNSIDFPSSRRVTGPRVTRTIQAIRVLCLQVSRASFAQQATPAQKRSLLLSPSCASIFVVYRALAVLDRAAHTRFTVSF